MTRDEWLVERRKYITGTQISCLFGLNPYKSMKQVMKEKARGLEIADNWYCRRGRILEPAIIQAVNELTPYTAIIPDIRFYVNDKIAATIDGWLIRGSTQGPVECKTINNFFKFTETNLKYTYLLQLICQMLCVPCNTGKLAFFNLQKGIEFIFVELLGEMHYKEIGQIILAEAGRALVEGERFEKNKEFCRFVKEELDLIELYVQREQIV